jgi:hypothetical protein
MRLLLLAQTNDESLDFEWMSFLLLAPIHRRLMLATLLLLQLGHMISANSPPPQVYRISLDFGMEDNQVTYLSVLDSRYPNNYTTQTQTSK